MVSTLHSCPTTRSTWVLSMCSLHVVPIPGFSLDTPSQSRYMHVRLISNSKPAVCVNAELLSVLSCSRQTDNLSRRYTASRLSCEWPHHLCDPKSDKQQKVNGWILNIKIYSFSSSCFYYG